MRRVVGFLSEWIFVAVFLYYFAFFFVEISTENNEQAILSTTTAEEYNFDAEMTFGLIL